MNIADYIIIAVVLILLVVAIRYSIKHRNQCCGDCSKCSEFKSCKRKDNK